MTQSESAIKKKSVYKLNVQSLCLLNDKIKSAQVPKQHQHSLEMDVLRGALERLGYLFYVVDPATTVFKTRKEIPNYVADVSKK